ncbi:MAG: galactokinase [Lachnospiraceae bacterium]|nr:galactokinase [Lachnospiraceae bacterium]
MDRSALSLAFYQIFGREEGEPVFVFSPGRVNLIGEHTDYNGGHVFPAALTIGTYFAARKRRDRRVRFYSGNFKNTRVIERTLDSLAFDGLKGYSNYPMGMIWAYETKLGLKLPSGMDCYIIGNIPNASGLSSSASIEVGMGVVLNTLFGFEVSNQDIALLGQYSENNYNGVNCGIMDQFSIAMGKKDNAIFLDCATLDYVYAPLQMDGLRIVIACTNKKRGLADSKYNERRAECEEALRRLNTVIEAPTLGSLTPEEFEAHKDVIEDETLIRRARHAVLENARTVEAVKRLQAGDIEGFGKLMNESHVSLRDDYEVTGLELDTLAEASWSVPGVIGARMTGAGFGGCAVAIVREDAVENYKRRVGRAYLNKVGYEADFYVAAPGDGAHAL